MLEGYHTCNLVLSPERGCRIQKPVRDLGKIPDQGLTGQLPIKPECLPAPGVERERGMCCMKRAGKSMQHGPNQGQKLLEHLKSQARESRPLEQAQGV